MLRILATAFLIVVVLAALAVAVPWFEIRSTDRDIDALAGRLRARSGSWPDDGGDARAVAFALEIDQLARQLRESDVFEGRPSFDEPWPDEVWDRTAFFVDGVEEALLSTDTAAIATDEFPFLPARRAAEVFCHRARRHAAAGEHGKAAVDIGIAFEIGRRIDRAIPSLIGLLVSVSIDSLASQALVACAEQAGRGTPYLDLLEGRLADPRVAARSCAAYRAEVRYLLEMIENAPGFVDGRTHFRLRDLGSKARASREELCRRLERHLELADLDDAHLFEALVSPEIVDPDSGIGPEYLQHLRRVVVELDLGRAVCIAGLRLSTRDDARLADVLPTALRGLVRLRTDADGRILEPAEEVDITDDVRVAYRWPLPR